MQRPRCHLPLAYLISFPWICLQRHCCIRREAAYGFLGVSWKQDLHMAGPLLREDVWCAATLFSAITTDIGIMVVGV